MTDKTKALLSKAIVIVIKLRQYAIEHLDSPGRHSGLCQSAADVLVELSALAGDQADEITQLRKQLAAVMAERDAIIDRLNEQPAIDPIHAAGGCYCRECKHRETVLCPMSEVYEYPWKDTRDNDFCSRGEPRGGEGQCLDTKKATS